MDLLTGFLSFELSYNMIRLFLGSILYVNAIMVSPFPILGIKKKKKETYLSSVECMACNTSNLMTCLLSLLTIYICVYLQQYFLLLGILSF